MRLEHTTHIAAPVARVWDLTLDVERWPDTSPTMTSIERLDDGPLRPGSTARVRQPGQRARVWTVETVDPQRCFAWATRAFGCRLVGTHTMEPADDGTTSTLAIDLEGAAAGLVGRLLAPAVRTSLAKENAGFASAASRAVGTTPAAG